MKASVIALSIGGIIGLAYYFNKSKPLLPRPPDPIGNVSQPIESIQPRLPAPVPSDPAAAVDKYPEIPESSVGSLWSQLDW